MRSPTVDSPASFAGSFAFCLAAYAAIGVILQSQIFGRSLAIGLSSVPAAALATLVVILPFFADSWSRRFSNWLSDTSKLALLFFAFTILIAGPFAATLVRLEPQATLSAFALFSVIFLGTALLNVIGVRSVYLVVVAIVAFGLCLGCLLSFGWQYASWIIPGLIVAVSVGGIGFLGHSAWTSDNTLQKTGAYAVSFILSYELWMFLQAMTRN